MYQQQAATDAERRTKVIAELASYERAAASARALQVNASRMRDPASYGRLERMLGQLYRSIDRLRAEVLSWSK